MTQDSSISPNLLLPPSYATSLLPAERPNGSPGEPEAGEGRGAWKHDDQLSHSKVQLQLAEMALKWSFVVIWSFIIDKLVEKLLISNQSLKLKAE